MNVCIFGTGYVGLVQAAVLAEVGHNVICVDIDIKKIEALKLGHIPIYEPGLADLVKSCYQSGTLQFTTNAKDGVLHADIIFIAVGTPPDEDGSADLQYVLKVAESIGTYMDRYKVVVNKSTVPVGTADKVADQLAAMLGKRRVEIEYDVVSNPEFLKEGAALSDCRRPDRIVIGTDSDKAEAQMRELYAPFNRNHEKIIKMGVRSAELTKYAANCMLATKISFMNEVANLAERLGADIEEVRQGIGSDQRIGYHFIYPGCGYGGSCFPKDVKALCRTADEVGYAADLLNAVETVNAKQKETLFERVRAVLPEVKGKTICLWGLSFKPETDDMREASSRVLMEQLWAAGASVQAYDPKAMGEAHRIYGDREDLVLAPTKEAALEGADLLVVVTEWKEFKSPDFALIKSQLKFPVIVDGRNLYSPSRLSALGLMYFGIGRGKSIFKVA
ncbi:UDP-glucose dehydrogenase family protein [Microbulbifer sp. ANSA003]|uniref:UDP-glucose dehydrogenase family protein n=1 Tax=Microbulbifer sp. ANSA003 TaxID=3243360 RepID=UPI004041E06D